LQIQPLFDTPFFVLFRIGQSELIITRQQESSSDYVQNGVVYWEVDDLMKAHKELIARGAQKSGDINITGTVRKARLVDPFGNVFGITDTLKDCQSTSLENQPSETAMAVAFCRALAASEGIGPDHLSGLFVNDGARLALYDHQSREYAINKIVSRELFGYITARTKYFDDIFVNALDDNFPQIVFFGAGYDTRACRFQSLIQDTTIFETDIRSTQQRKLEILKESVIEPFDNLAYVSVNFDSESITEALVKSGFETGKKTLFIGEGLLYYLSLDTADRIFRFIRENSPEGSIVCFDFMTEERQSVNPAEPFNLWISKDEIKNFLSQRGFYLAECIGPDEMEDKFLRIHENTSGYKVLPSFCFAKAIKV
jgi:methyltransferase (TIGR00027 family)